MSDQKVVLITGASSGVGQFTARLLSQQGYKVFGTIGPQAKLVSRLRQFLPEAAFEKGARRTFRLNDFSFTFAGDREKGKVTLSHKGSEAFPLNVIKEGDKWKVDER
jgi:NAD(P)-dependent dehydrogenase (short-subunit alcohol dehydrogenase family)